MSGGAGGEGRYVDNRLLPVMRDAVTTVQMILFQVLRESLRERQAELDETLHTRLAGAVINNLFGTGPVDEAVSAFAAANRELVEAELRGLAEHCAGLRPILTDALRMQTICDNQEGIHSMPSLLMARALGLLEEARELPLPSTFMLQVRTLAVAHGLIEPMAPEDPAAADPPA